MKNVQGSLTSADEPATRPPEEDDVKQVQITRTRRTAGPAEVDTRTPSGKVLPF
jgi:hypothetical protein